MKSKLAQFIPLVIALVVIGYRYLSVWCVDSYSTCYTSWVHWTYQPFTQSLYFFALYSLIVVVVAILVNRTMFNFWASFASWAVPLLLIFIFTQPVFPQSFLSTDRDDAARLAGIVFTVASLALIGWKAFSVRRNKV